MSGFGPRDDRAAARARDTTEERTRAVRVGRKVWLRPQTPQERRDALVERVQRASKRRKRRVPPRAA